MASRLTDFSAIRGAFSNRNFALYAAGNAVSLIGLWVQRLAVGYLAWQLTKSGFWLGAVAFADLFPVILIGPIGGVLADRHNPQRILLICQCLAMAQVAALFVLTATDMINIELLFSLALFHGIIVAFSQPARLSFIPLLVRKQNLTAAVAISSIMFNGARFVGPAVAGFIISVYGVAPAFAFDTVTYLAMIAALAAIRITVPSRDHKERRSVLADVREGMAYTAAHPAIGPLLLILVAICVLARPALELLPGFADAVFGMGAGGLATLTSAVGLGAISGGLWLAQRGRLEGLTRIALVSGGISGLAVLVFATTTWFPLAVLATAVAGFTMVSCGVGTQTLLQAAVDDRMRGRVLSLWGVIFRGGPAIGALTMGALSGPFGLVLPVAGGGLLCLVWAAVMLPRRHRLAAGLEASAMGDRPVGA